MRKYGKLLLVLGILAANPAWASADGFLSGLRPSLPQSKVAQKEANEQRAHQVMNALKQARVDGYDVRVEVRGDTVKVDGKVRNVNHRALAERACRQVNGIQRVVNNLKYVPSGNVQQTAGRVVDNSLRPATYNRVEGASSGVQQVHFQKPGKRKTTKKTSTPPRRIKGYQPRPATRKVQPAPQPWNTPKPSNVNVPSKPRKVVTAPPAVPPVAMPKIEKRIVIPAPTPVPVPAPAKMQLPLQVPAPVPMPMPEPPKVAPAKPLDVTAALKPMDLQIPAQPEKPRGPSNQEIAQNIASSLEGAGLVGYNVEVRYDDGIALLGGEVPTAQQIQAAGFAASRVEGVKEVKNQLKIGGPVAQTAFNPGAYPMPMNAMPASYGPMPGGMMPAGMGASMGAPMGAPMGGGPTSIGAAGNYSNPQLPSHAWPAYAQYPNSAAVSYPKQHSASAFPYIGPFYPYPQVPLGWREVSLQWDDGYWQLDFEQKKDAWYWLWNPKNWH